MQDITRHSNKDVWDAALRREGRVVFDSNGPRIRWVVVIGLLSVLLVAMFVMYVGDRVTGIQAVVSTTAVVAIIALLLLRERSNHKGRQMIVEQDSIQLTNGARLYFSEIERVQLYQDNRYAENAGYIFVMSEPAWNRYRKGSGSLTRLSIRLFKLFYRVRGVYVASYIGVDHGEMVAWLNDLISRARNS